MLYYLFAYLEEQYQLIGASVFQFITFRAALAAILSLILSLFIGKRLINYLRKAQIGEVVRDEQFGPSHAHKAGTPTMGGIIILISILVPILLVGQIKNIYVILMMVATLWMGIIGLIDDYIKVFKKNKAGLAGKSKVVGQVVLGFIIGATLYLHPDSSNLALTSNLPFFKTYVFDYNFLGLASQWAWVIFIPVIIFIVTAVTNAVNLTDGIDGLAAGTTAIVGTGLGILAYMAGNVNLSSYLNILYVPNSGEVVVFLAALVGACIGFLWYNAHPAQVFMGDTGSMALGGAVVASAIIIKMELLIPILCGIYLAESGSVILQVIYFKYTKRKFGEGKRIFKMSPLHHHYEKLGFHESKIATRFWIVAVLLVLFTLAILKLR